MERVVTAMRLETLEERLKDLFRKLRVLANQLDKGPLLDTDPNMVQFLAAAKLRKLVDNWERGLETQ